MNSSELNKIIDNYKVLAKEYFKSDNTYEFDDAFETNKLNRFVEVKNKDGYCIGIFENIDDRKIITGLLNNREDKYCILLNLI